MSEPTKKPREFWIVDIWNPVISHRTTLDEDPGKLPSSADVFHVREVDPAYDAMVVAMAEALEKLSRQNGGQAQLYGYEALALYREWEKKS